MQKGARESAAAELWVLAEEPSDRVALEREPRAAVVESYVFTRAAEQTWATINQELKNNKGRFFWIGGPAGCGKTHLLDYVLALEARAGSIGPENLRGLTVALEFGDRAREVAAEELERQVLAAVARELTASRRGAVFWRDVPPADGLTMVLEEARRQGFRAVTIALDFGAAAVAPGLGFFDALAQHARESRGIRLAVLAAGRGVQPKAALALEAAPADRAELALTAIARARKLEASGEAAAKELYLGVDTGDVEPRRIFPFHPACLPMLAALAEPQTPVASLAKIVRAILAADTAVQERHGPALIGPAQLMEYPSIGKRAAALLGEGGRAAYKGAYAALQGFTPGEGQLARRIIDLLALNHIASGPIALDDEQLGGLLSAGNKEPVRSSQLDDLLRRLSTQSRGIVRIEPAGVRFDPAFADAAQLQAFNRALELARKFEAGLQRVEVPGELRAALRRLEQAMADTLEEVASTAGAVDALAAELGGRLAAERQRELAAVTELCERGPATLVELAADREARDGALRNLATYEDLRRLAAMAPRIRAMRGYLASTGLAERFDSEPGRDRRLTQLETECQLLMVAAGPGLLASPARNLAAIEARFEKFKWTYIEQYRAAHSRRQHEIEGLAPIIEDTGRYLEALERLDTIAALGAPAAEELKPRLHELRAQVVRCAAVAPLGAEPSPRCAGCGFVIGTPSPRSALARLSAQVNRALKAKLTTLSHSAIARLIRLHDQSHRLEGLLRIIQAAQSDALVEVLDDRLAHYLGRLLDEGPEAPQAEPKLSAVIKPIAASPFKPAGLPKKSIPRVPAGVAIPTSRRRRSS